MLESCWRKRANAIRLAKRRYSFSSLDYSAVYSRDIIHSKKLGDLHSTNSSVSKTYLPRSSSRLQPPTKDLAQGTTLTSTHDQPPLHTINDIKPNAHAHSNQHPLPLHHDRARANGNPSNGLSSPTSSHADIITNHHAAGRTDSS